MIAVASTKRVLITGASRGIGLELAKYYKAQGWHVIAAVRNPAAATELHKLSQERIVALDVADERPLPRPPPPPTLLTKEDLMRQFEVNSVGPLLVARAFLPNLELAAGMRKHAISAYISSKMGSIEANVDGGGYCYLASKTAVNSLVKSLSIELGPRGISTVLLHPGYVQTDMNDQG
ncbi:short chain dehydrogenase [Achlya hypogyna]|uniref:Short chain dehydrogenase n=1 Tax=Achlya hypogyna TaxID=1202772 RepID=A0A1V9Z892_ACHHY|nr:short chain dehydrogenase [Achlya hypogyna]